MNNNRRRSIPRLAAATAGAAFVLYILYGAILFWGPWTYPPATNVQDLHTPHDVCIVFTGGEDRIEEGFALLARGYSDSIVISSAPDDQMIRLSERYLLAGQHPFIVEGKATSTHGNAYYTSGIVKHRNFQSIILVTNSFHMNRAYRLLWLALRGTGATIHCRPLDMYPGVAPSQRRKISSYRKLIISERIKGTMNFIKFLYDGTRISGNNPWEDSMEIMVDSVIFKKLFHL